MNQKIKPVSSAKIILFLITINCFVELYALWGTRWFLPFRVSLLIFIGFLMGGYLFRWSGEFFIKSSLAILLLMGLRCLGWMTESPELMILTFLLLGWGVIKLVIEARRV